MDPRVSGANEDWMRGTHVKPHAEDDHVIKKLRGSCYSQRLGLEVGYLWTIFRTSSVYGWGYKRRNCK